MNLLNLMLTMLIFIFILWLRRLEFSTYINWQFLHEITSDNSSLVFIKPENLSKTELVEKFKELSSSKSLNELKKEDKQISKTDLFKSYFSKTLAFFLKFNSILIKITLFTIIISYFKRFKLMRFIWSIINFVLLSMFGIALSDVYGFKEIFEYIKYYWMEYVNFIHENKFYKILVKIFNVFKESDVNSEKPSNQEINEVKSEKVSNSEIVKNKESYDFPSSDRKFEIEKIGDTKNNWGNLENTKINEESNSPFYKNTYFLIGISFITLSLIYIYWDSISELFKNIKPDLGKDDNENGSNTTETPVFLDPQEEYEKYFKELSSNEELYDLDVIRSQDKGKAIDYSDIEKTKWEDSPTTPKASNLPLNSSSNLGVMIPISKEK